MRVAIVGAGVSGLVAAHLLHREHDVHVLEAGAHAGGHTNTVRVDAPDGPHFVDTGFIVFNDRNYPRFEALLRELGVASQPSDMGFGVSDGHGGFEYTGTSLNGLYARRAHLVSARFQRMVGEYVRFNREARALLAGEDDPSLAAWLQDRRFSEDFVQRLIVPQAAAVWSADPAQMWTFPARFLVEFFANHGMLGLRGRPQWRTVTGGSHGYVHALTAPFRDRIRLDTPVTSVRRDGDGVLVTTRGGGGPERFDEVVLACHADQALALLTDPSDREHELLGAFPYQPNEAVLHTDTSLMPRRRRAWASWNYHLTDTPSGLPTVTYWMNRLQSLRAADEYLVTLNRTADIDPAAVLRTISYAHPVYTSAGQAAQRRHAEISGQRHTHYCGAYWGWGFHEDGVASAHAAVALMPGRAGAHPQALAA
jgi:predicted NAD/FAD-binding protein